MPGNWDRLNTRALFASDNQWGIPTLPATHWVPQKLVAYNDRWGTDTAPPESAVHFFLDDYRFETVWTKPQRPLSRLQRVGAALTPDFSMWREMPLVMQLWQVYRSRWCGAWMLNHNIKVVPTISWSGRESFPFAFTGIAVNSTVAISTVGLIRDREAMKHFEAGLEEMMSTLLPSRVLVYGHHLDTFSNFDAEFVCLKTRWRQR